MKQKILKLLALIALLLSFGWMINNSDWEPKIAFVVSLSALIGFEYTEERNRSKNPDVALYKDFIKTVPSTGTIKYLIDKDMRNPIDTSQLKDLDRFRNDWNNAEHEFVNLEIEKKKKELMASCNEFFGYFALNTWHLHGTLQSVPAEWRDEQPDRYTELTNHLNSLADRIVEKHQEFIRLCKKKLSV